MEVKKNQRMWRCQLYPAVFERIEMSQSDYKKTGRIENQRKLLKTGRVRTDDNNNNNNNNNNKILVR